MTDDLAGPAAHLRRVASYGVLSADLEAMGRAVGIYRKSLIASGIPRDEAAELVSEWHRIAWARIAALSEGGTEMAAQ